MGSGEDCDRPILITGGAGFIGCNLAARLAASGHRVIVLDALSRPGVSENLSWLQRRYGQRIIPVIADVRDRGALSEAVRGAAGVFHLAAQVAVTTSLAEPFADHDVNVSGTLNVLDAARRDGVPVIFASTNKVYGDLDHVPLTERIDRYEPAVGEIARQGLAESCPLSFHTPYGCSKGAADQYVLDYARSFGLRSAVLRMSCIYGPRQFGTEDQGWVAHFLIRALRDEPIVIYGDGKQVRDVLFVDDAVDAYLRVWRAVDRLSGQAFNLGGGPGNSVSLLRMIDAIAALRGRPLQVAFSGWRRGDQKYFVSDTRKLGGVTGWRPRTRWQAGLGELHRWLVENRCLPMAPHQIQDLVPHEAAGAAP